MPNCRAIRVVIADDHTVFREGLSAIIGRSPDMSIAAEGQDWPEAIRKVSAHRPEIALLGARMPGMRAVEGVATIHRKCPGVGIVVLSAFDPEEEARRVVQAGAKGFLLKNCVQEELLECIRTVHEGRTFLAAETAAKLAARVQAPELTERQTEILQLVAEGKTNKEVGVAMGITEGTVKVHVNHIFRKLRVAGRTAAITKALQCGVVRLPTNI